jgi:hypothetical protein
MFLSRYIWRAENLSPKFVVHFLYLCQVMWFSTKNSYFWIIFFPFHKNDFLSRLVRLSHMVSDNDEKIKKKEKNRFSLIFDISVSFDKILLNFPARHKIEKRFLNTYLRQKIKVAQLLSSN